MTSAYILITAILLLGGIIAALGDRLGTKVGKARLRLFGLRPRQTAVVMTIITGTLISASTLGILFAASESLRQGVFELDEILRRRRRLKQEVQKITEEKEAIEEDLNQAKLDQTEVQEKLATINENFQKNTADLAITTKKVNTLRKDIRQLQGEQQQLVQQRTQLQQQIAPLQQQLKERDQQLVQQDQTLTQRKQEIANRDQRLNQQEIKISAQEQRLQQQQQSVQELEVQRNRLVDALEEQTQIQNTQIQELDEAIALRDQALTQRQSQLATLEQQLRSLQQNVSVLQQFSQMLRQGELAILRGQMLGVSTVQVNDSDDARIAIESLLQQANQVVVEATENGQNQQVIQISVAQVEQLINRLQDGQNYLVRILSAGNYVSGESQVQVFVDIELNQILFEEGEIIATLPINPQMMNPEEIQKQLELLLASCQFRARRAGVLGGIQVEDNSRTILFRFLTQLQETELDQIQAIALEKTDTIGPLKLQLLGLQNGEIVLRTSS